MLLDWLAVVQDNPVIFILRVRNEVTLALSYIESLHIPIAMHGICALQCFVGDDWYLPILLRNNYLAWRAGSYECSNYNYTEIY